MNKVTGFLLFAMGAAVGSFATWRLINRRFDLVDREEFDMDEAFDETEPEPVEEKSARVVLGQTKPDIAEYAAAVKKTGYASYSKKEDAVKKEEVNEPVNKPYVISPDEFGEIDEYEKISLTYYADKTLADDNDELVEDVDAAVGYESLKHFGEYEDDSVFVRNDRLECDYEILLDQRRYSDVVEKRPH